MIQRLLIVAVLFIAPHLAAAQSQYSAERAPVSFTMGGAYSFFVRRIRRIQGDGRGGLRDVLARHLGPRGLEGEGRWLTQNGPRGFSEYNYLIGPVYRITLVEHHGLHPYVKGLIGAGIVEFPQPSRGGTLFRDCAGGRR